MAELRREPIARRWVVISKESPKVPADYIPFKPPYQPQEELHPCPFCPGNEAMTPKEVFAIRPGGDQWVLRVVPNKFPIFRVEGDFDRRPEGMYDLMEAIGAHEIVIESPDHRAHMGSMSSAEIERILTAYKERTLDLKNDTRIEQILILKNYPGIFNRHPHSHVLAMPILPRRIDEELSGVIDYYKRKERCIYCDIVKEEMAAKKRIVLETVHFLVFCPFASRYPFETWIIPKFHSPDFYTIDAGMISDLSGAIQSTFGSFYKLLSDPPYSLVFHASPVQRRFHRDEYHWHIEIRLRIGLREGFEWATGFFVNPTPPENAAAYLREMI